MNEIDIPKSMGVKRTAGANKTKNEIEKDFQNTLGTWDEIKKKALDSNAPSLFMRREILSKGHSEIHMTMKQKII